MALPMKNSLFMSCSDIKSEDFQSNYMSQLENPSLTRTHLSLPYTGSSTLGGSSPGAESGYGSVSSPPSRTCSQWSPACATTDFSNQDCLLTSAANTLNNYGAAAYHNSLDSSFDNTFNTLDQMQDGSWTSPLSACGSPSYMAHTPAPTPGPEMDLLPAEEPSLQLLQGLSLQNDASSSPFNNMTDNTYQLSPFPSNINASSPHQNNLLMPSNQISMVSFDPESSSMSTSNQTTYSSNQFDQLACSQYSSPQQQYTSGQEDEEHREAFSDDMLNIPREQLLMFPQENYPSLQQLISSAELQSPDTLGPVPPSPAVTQDPRMWKKEEIRTWLAWASTSFSLTTTISVDMLPPTGQELCTLSKLKLQQRLGETDGEKLASHLDHLLGVQGLSLPQQDSSADPYELYTAACLRLSSPGSGQIQLWQFLLELLAHRSNSHIITWENTNAEFKILEPDEVARQWGDRKTKPNMNYDKLSRALRYYYDRQLMTKVPGKRYAYRVSFPNLEQLHAAQQGSEPRPAPDFALISALSSAPSPAPTWRSTDTPSPRPFC